MNAHSIYLSVEVSFSSPNRRVWVMRESFFSKKGLSINLIFFQEGQSLINKVSTAT